MPGRRRCAASIAAPRPARTPRPRAARRAGRGPGAAGGDQQVVPARAQLLEERFESSGADTWASSSWANGVGSTPRGSRVNSSRPVCCSSVHAWLVEDLPGDRGRVLTQETQIGRPAAALAEERPNPMLNGHQAWLAGLVRAASGKMEPTR